uniref:Co-chaperonin GroES n=1 Tax=uncultured virus TaxID=340016 RepID=A0A221S2Z2_9VIRU|nr:co-chaperonin GroES [uncultured virus]
MINETPAMSELAKAREEKRLLKEKTMEEIDKLIPIPVGWSVLIAIPKPEDTYESGLAKAHETKRVETILSSIGLVIDMGPQAYKDERFGGEPWCKVEDYVMFRPNSGTRFLIDDQEYRLLNDDSVEAVVPDPSAVRDPR